MSFSVQVPEADGRAGLEWSGSSLGGVFAQRGNLLRPRFLKMLAEILRFNRLATRIRKRGRSRLRSEEHTSELQSQSNLVCRLLLEKKKIEQNNAFDNLLQRPHPAAFRHDKVSRHHHAHLTTILPGREHNAPVDMILDVIIAPATLV